MRQWAYLACRVLGLAQSIVGLNVILSTFVGYSFTDFIMLRESRTSWFVLASPVFLVLTGFIVYVFADLISRMLVPEARDVDLAPPKTTPKEVAVIGWAITGVFLLAKGIPYVIFYGAFWLWNTAGQAPESVQTALQGWLNYVPWYMSEITVGAVLLAISTRLLGFRKAS